MIPIKQESGSVLAHVLIMSAIMTIVAAGMVSMVMMQYRATASVEQQTHAKKLDEIALARLISHWSRDDQGFQAGSPCQSIPVDGSTAGYTCSPVGTCPCTCDPTDPNLPTIVVTNTPGNVCFVSIISAELYQNY